MATSEVKLLTTKGFSKCAAKFVLVLDVMSHVRGPEGSPGRDKAFTPRSAGSLEGIHRWFSEDIEKKIDTQKDQRRDSRDIAMRYEGGRSREVGLVDRAAHQGHASKGPLLGGLFPLCRVSPRHDLGDAIVSRDSPW